MNNIKQALPQNANIFPLKSQIKLEKREARNGHKAMCYWFTGLSGSGKTIIARAFEERIFNTGSQVTLLDGDNVRLGLNSDLGFSDADRFENIRRIGHVAKLMYDSGLIVICSFISPKISMREYVRKLFPSRRFCEIYIKCSLDECIRRDPKGLYKKAMNNEISNFTGMDSLYEEPEYPDYVLDTEKNDFKQCLDSLNIY